jgi:hypothetical protein
LSGYGLYVAIGGQLINIYNFAILFNYHSGLIKSSRKKGKDLYQKDAQFKTEVFTEEFVLSNPKSLCQ